MNAEHENDSQAAVSVQRVGALLAIMVSEGIVEDSEIGLKAIAALETMGLISGTEPEVLDGAQYRRLVFTPAGRLARGEDAVGDWRDDVELAQAVDKLQTKLNFGPEPVQQHWSRGDVISLVVAREQLRARRNVAPRAIVVSDPDGAALERVAELFTIDLEYELPDRTAVMSALVDRCVPANNAGDDLLRRLTRTGLAYRTGGDGRSDLTPLELTSVGRALVTAVGGGKAPW